MDPAIVPPRLAAAVLLLGLWALALGGCASVRAPAGPQPGTGDIAFRLLWEGTADLDLHVLDPEGGRIDFISRQTESGGLLDIDCNAGPQELCDRPVENVFWPEGTAPQGTYQVWIELFQLAETAGETSIDGSWRQRSAGPARPPSPEDLALLRAAEQDPETLVSFELQILHGERVVATHPGEVSATRPIGGPWEVVW